MAGGQERILRRRIRSVQSTKKITRAMELIAGEPDRRAPRRGCRPRCRTADTITEVVRDLAAAGAGRPTARCSTPRPEIRKVAHVVDRRRPRAVRRLQLVGHPGRRGLDARARASWAHDYALVVVGRKAEGYFRYRDYRIDASFSGFSDQPTYEDARAIARAVEAPFLAGEYDLVELVYTRFVSAGRQEVVVRPLMPLDRETLEGGDARPTGRRRRGRAPTYEFEPSPTRSSSGCCRGTPRRASTPRC